MLDPGRYDQSEARTGPFRILTIVIVVVMLVQLLGGRIGANALVVALKRKHLNNDIICQIDFLSIEKHRS